MVLAVEQRDIRYKRDTVERNPVCEDNPAQLTFKKLKAEGEAKQAARMKVLVAEKFKKSARINPMKLPFRV